MNSFKNYLLFSLLSFFVACGQKTDTNKYNPLNINSNMSKPNNPYYSTIDTTKLTVSNEEWKKILPENLYYVAREADTERAFTGTLWKSEQKGTYYCAVCGNKLFRSNQKFVSSCGWPSFFEQENPKSIHFLPDNSFGMQRTEALCSRCNSHLGHLFDDGPKPTGKRYCMNAVSLDFVPDEALQTIVLGGGCFWCIEAVFENVNGIVNVESGYAGGTVKNPTYEEVCTGNTGAAEVIKITYDNNVVSLSEILQIFFTVHDPTTLNKQGADVGTQYRSVIFYANEEDKKIAQEIISKIDNAAIFNAKIVTSLEPFDTFYTAEKYHQNYYQNNSEKPYCKMVILPKLEKFEKLFKENLKQK